MHVRFSTLSVRVVCSAKIRFVDVPAFLPRSSSLAVSLVDWDRMASMRLYSGLDLLSGPFID